MREVGKHSSLDFLLAYSVGPLTHYQMTKIQTGSNSNKLQTTFKSAFNPFPNKPWFLRVCCTNLLKTLWEKEKLLVTSNFSFSHSVFYLLGELAAIFIKSKIVICQRFEYGRVKYLSFGKGLK